MFVQPFARRQKLLHTRTWNGLFKQWSETAVYPATPLKIGSLSAYCYVATQDGYLRSLNVVPKQIIVDALNKHLVVGGSLYFKVILFEDTAHIYAEYNQIIGSRLLARISKASLPEGFCDEEVPANNVA